MANYKIYISCLSLVSGISPIAIHSHLEYCINFFSNDILYFIVHLSKVSSVVLYSLLIFHAVKFLRQLTVLNCLLSIGFSCLTIILNKQENCLFFDHIFKPDLSKMFLSKLLTKVFHLSLNS